MNEETTHERSADPVAEAAGVSGDGAVDQSVAPKGAAGRGQSEEGVAGEIERCANCQAERTGAYCHRCGQEFLEGRLTIRRFWHEFASRYLKLEQGLWLTFREMLTDPGGVAHRYVKGQRRRYVNPLGYFLVMATVSLFSFILVEDLFVEYMAAQNQGAFTSSSAEEREVIARMFGDDPNRGFAEGTAYVLKRTNTYAMLLLGGFLALVLRLFFPGPKKEGHTLAETLVFSVYGTAHVLFVGSALNVLLLLSPLSPSSFFLIGTLGYAIAMGWAALGFYDRTAWTFVRAVLAYAVAYVLFMLLFMLVFIGFVAYVYAQGAG